MGPFKVLQLKALQNISVSCIFPAAVRARWCWYNSTRRSIDAPLTRGKGKRGGGASTQLEIGTFSRARTHTHTRARRAQSSATQSFGAVSKHEVIEEGKKTENHLNRTRSVMYEAITKLNRQGSARVCVCVRARAPCACVCVCVEA